MKRKIGQYLIIIVFSLEMACAPPSEALKPVALQSQQNIESLANNVRVLLALYQSVLTASNKSIIYQQISKTEQEIIAVVGAATLPPPTLEWDELFTQAATTPLASREKYLERYQFVKSAFARGLEASELERIQYKEGWIYSAATNPDFTPQKAHELLKTLLTLKQENVNNNEKYFIAAEEVLKRYDPLLGFRRETIESAYQLFKALEQELNLQLTYATLYSQGITEFSETEGSVEKTLRAVVTGTDQQQLKEVLGNLSKKYLGNTSLSGMAQEAAIELLTRQLGSFKF